MNNKIVDNTERCIVFPGQGSQFVGMGKELFLIYKDHVQQANECLGYDIQKLCLQDPDRSLSQTQFTQPALYLVNALNYLQYSETQQALPAYFLGHSLGEYNALQAAGVFDFITGLRLVQKRGQLFSNLKEGGMLAILGNVEDTLQNLLSADVEIANYNSQEQLILSGNKPALKNLEAILTQEKIKFIPLNVSGAFHSRFMLPAAQEFEIFLRAFTFNAPQVPVLSNVSNELYTDSNVSQMLIKQITGTVLWRDQVKKVLYQGVEEFVELGPGKVLTNIIKTIKTHQSDRSAAPVKSKINLGSSSFINRYNLKKAYVIGGMYKGISSSALVIRSAKAGLLSFYGTGGVELQEVEKEIKHIKSSIHAADCFGINFLSNPLNPEAEMALAQVCIRENIKIIEASAFGSISMALVYFRLKGLKQDTAPNRIMAKVSHPDVARIFLSPPPGNYVDTLVQKGLITDEEARIGKTISMADEITLEADSGGHTDQKSGFVLVPDIIRMRNELMQQYTFTSSIHIGAAGGLGTPEAIASAFMLGADYVLTGSINQCTIEAGTSDLVKELLSKININDTAIAPAGDMFEFGAKVQVMKKGSLFSSRANRLYELYKQFGDLDLIDSEEIKNLETNYFKRPLKEIWNEVEDYLKITKPDQLGKLKNNPKAKLAYIFKWYFFQSTRFALAGDNTNKLDFQVQCGPALGAFNCWVKGSNLEDWRQRHIDVIGIRLMSEAEDIFHTRYNTIINQ